MKSWTRFGSLLGVAAALGAGAPQARAHHSDVQFEIGSCTTIQGAVRTLEWVYPHVWLWIVVPKKDGAAAGADGGDIWGFEFPSPTQVMHLDKHWSKTALQKGEQVTVSYSPMKDGRHGGWMHSVTTPDGTVLAGAPGRCDRNLPPAVPTGTRQ